MKRILMIALTGIALMSVTSVNAQDPNDQKEESVFTTVEQMPEFPGGMDALMKYLGENIKYPEIARESGKQGVVYVSFVVRKDGNITDSKVLRGIGNGCDREALRVVSKMPNWKPGMQKGKAVSVQYTLPIKFAITKDKPLKGE
ncbi:MAG: energy transducer TonB [Flavobacteriales bacterium]|nr:energy transducer TonB [Flavobacteriales bacterium]